MTRLAESRREIQTIFVIRLFQDFRVKTMACQDTPQMRLMNRLEEIWFSDYIMCDQLAMAAALDKDAMKTTRDYYVRT